MNGVTKTKIHLLFPFNLYALSRLKIWQATIAV